MFNVFDIPDCDVCYTPLDERGHQACNHKHEKFVKTNLVMLITA